MGDRFWSPSFIPEPEFRGSLTRSLLLGLVNLDRVFFGNTVNGNQNFVRVGTNRRRKSHGKSSGISTNPNPFENLPTELRTK